MPHTGPMPTLSLALGERSYDIHVENGALDRVGEVAYRAGLDGKIAIMTAVSYTHLDVYKRQSVSFQVAHIPPGGKSGIGDEAESLFTGISQALSLIHISGNTSTRSGSFTANSFNTCLTPCGR